MKKLFFLFFALGTTIQGFSQITLDHSFYIYHADIYVTDLGNNDYKYVITDSTGFRLYNLDYSLYLKVVTPIPLFQPPSYYQVAYISKSLFDCDSSNIEYAMTNAIVASNFYVYRTDGTLLFERDSVTGTWGIISDGSVFIQPIVNTPEGTKLFLQDNGNASGLDSSYIYSLCGTLTVSMSEVSPNHNYVEVFPNPAEALINFQINAPNNLEQFILTIYNASFQKVDEANIIGKNYQLDIKQKSLSAGTYLFDLRTNYKVFQTGKFIITK